MNCDYLYLEVQYVLSSLIRFFYKLTIDELHLFHEDLYAPKNSPQRVKYFDQNTLLFMFKFSSYLEKYYDKQPEHTVKFAVIHSCLLKACCILWARMQCVYKLSWSTVLFTSFDLGIRKVKSQSGVCYNIF